MFDRDHVRFDLSDGNLVTLHGPRVEVCAELKRASQLGDSPVRSDRHSAADGVAVEFDMRLLMGADVKGKTHGPEDFCRKRFNA